MKILYDHQIFSHQRYGGISRYFTNLINLGSKDPDIDVKVGFVTSKNEYFPKPFDFISKRLSKKLYKRVISINKAKSRHLLKSYDFDIFHPTYYQSYFLPFLDKKPFVLTVFDMMPELFPEYFPSDFNDISRKKVITQKADKIIAISNQTKNDLVNLLSIEEEKISVVHLSNDLNPELVPLKNYKIPENYLLYVGTRKHYKNFPRFLKSIAPIIKKNKNLNIVLAGGGELEAQEKEQLQELGILNKTFLFCNLTNDLLALLYKKAKVFIFPSLYEGFGIPILEAFSNNCPVVLSDTPVFKEIAKEGACYFDPTSEESMEFEIEKVLNDTDYRNEITKNATLVLKDFTPEKTYTETLKVYKSLL